jgi:Tfp pilus assembly protein PilP
MKLQIALLSLLLAFLEGTALPQKSGKSAPPPKPSAVQSTAPAPASPGEASPSASTVTTSNEPALPIYKYEQRGRRDPFRSLDVTTTVQATSAPIVRPPGLKGQLVSEIKIVGIVKSKGGLMAVAEGYRNKTYFIYPNDILYDGKVVEIRKDSVQFTQTLTDNFGKKLSQQVVKKLYPTRGEGNNEK